MTTKALFVAAMGGGAFTPRPAIAFTRTSGNILTATAHGLQTGSGPFKVMTSNADAPLGLTAAVRASLGYTPATDIQDETVTVAGKVYTWRDVPSTDGQVDVSATNATAAENLAAAINLGPGAGTKYGAAMTANPSVYAEAAGDVCTVFAKTLNATLGNAIAVAEAAAGAWAGAGVVLANGVSGTDYWIIRLSADTFSLATTEALAIAGTAVTISDAGTGAHSLVQTVDSLADAMEDVVTNFLTHSGTRVLPPSHNVANFWQTIIDGIPN